MNQFYFIKDKENHIRMENNEVKFTLNAGKEFINRKLMTVNGGFLFDGYSTWFLRHNEVKERNKDFSITFVLVPMSYESGMSGLISNINRSENQGYYIGLQKFGVIDVGFFVHDNFIHFESVNNHVEMRKINIVTVVFYETAGWCDLYVNGELSNRRQFERNASITENSRNCYIGKYVDYEKTFEDTKTGVFHGILLEMEMAEHALIMEDVTLRHKNTQYGEYFDLNDLDRSSFMSDINRPIYHLIAPGKWMNEPHGPCYYNGFYHIFYQFNPHAPIWDNIQWGHMVSEDMVHWRDMPLSLQVEKYGSDPDGCWSGSSIINKEGIPFLYYTAGNNNCFPNQGIARAKAKELNDAELKEWIKDESFLIKQKMGEGWLGEFRDPYVWLEEDTYYMLVGTGDAHNGGGNALLYTSDNGDHWKCHGFFLEYQYEINQEIGHVFELPVLLPLRNEKGSPVCHIFIFCACQVENDVVENYYFLGKWDKNKNKFDKYHEKAMLFDLGNGTFTGPSGLITPDGRRVVFSIAQGKRGPDEEFHAGWAHNGGLPIELSMLEEQLQIKPINEIYSLKSKMLICEENISFELLNRKLSGICENNLYMKVETNSGYIDIFIKEEENRLHIFYESDKKLFGIRNDNTGQLISKLRMEADLVDIGRENIQIELFIDGSLIEVYLNNLKSITTRFYTKAHRRRLEISGDIKRGIQYIEIFRMNSAY